MFERYTEKARRVIFFARYEASQLGAKAIETEHVLLGLLREDEGLVRRFFPRAETATREIRAAIEARVESGEPVSTSVDMPLSTASKRVLAYAQEESDRLRVRYIGTEHLLLGLLREETSIAADILRDRGLELSEIRNGLSRSPDVGPPLVIGQQVDPPIPFGSPGMVLSVLYESAFGAFSPGARQALFMARIEAGQMGSDAVDPEHVLLGILHLCDEVMLTVFPGLEGLFDDAKAEIGRRQPAARALPIRKAVPFSARAFRVLADADEMAGATSVEPAHLLAGVLSDEGSLAAELLVARGLTLDVVRRAVEGDETR